MSLFIAVVANAGATAYYVYLGNAPMAVFCGMLFAWCCVMTVRK